jgi:nucleotide-binding universal stress UspA family protein
MMSGTGPVVVGYDSSEHSRRPLRWAAEEARRRGCRLVVVYVVDDGGMAAWTPNGMAGWWPDVAVEHARTVLDAAAVELRRLFPTVEVCTRARVGSPARELLDEARDACVLVVGTRGRWEMAAFCLGSVAHAVTAQAACPVVVVRGEPELPGPNRPVVVGVDGSAGSMAALHFAAATAESSRASLVVVSAWDTTRLDPWLSYSGTASEAQIRRWARGFAERALETAVSELQLRHPGVAFRTRLEGGRAAQVLSTVGMGAALLVLGTRGAGALSCLVLGSTSHAVIRSAPCPVAVVPPAVPDGLLTDAHVDQHVDEPAERPVPST